VQARLDAQRERILAAATAQLADAGYAGCSITAVAARAGVAPGTLYNYLSGKTELLTEVFWTVAAGELDAVRAAVAVAWGTAEEIAAVVETFATRAFKAPRLAYALLAEPVDPAVEALRLRFREDFRSVLADVVSRGMASGLLPPQDPDVVAAALVGGIAEALLAPLRAGGGADATEPIVAVTLRAVGIDRPEG
jgi:AcrR family transcriptional regulator